MAYIGNIPAEAFSSFQKQDFTTSATTSYTLDHAVANQNELALFINFVRQEPTAAYTASGTSLTLTSATSASDDMYCVYLGKAVQTVNPPSGSVGTSQLSSSLDFSSKTITLASNMKNTPAFQAFISGDQTLNNDTVTTIAWNNETFDSNSDFDTSNYRFTPSVAGKYFVYINCNVDAPNGIYYASSEIQKNGSNIPSSRIVNIWENASSSDYSIEGIFLSYQGIVDMNGSTDYLTSNAYMAGGGTAGTVEATRTIWGAYRIIT